LGADLWGWELLGRTTLSSAGDTITVNNLPARTYLRIIVAALPSGAIRTSYRFNNDSGNNYASRQSSNGAADTTVTSQPEIFFDSTPGTSSIFVDAQVLNIATQEKLVIAHTAERNTTGAANAPTRRESVGKWANTANQITRVDIINTGAGDFAIGSEVIVLGRN
jgi:hypothetical protein